MRALRPLRRDAWTASARRSRACRPASTAPRCSGSCRRARRATPSTARSGISRPSAAGRPVWQLAGLGAPGPEITAFTLSLDTPEAMRAEAARQRPPPAPEDQARRRGRPRPPRGGAAPARRAARIIVDANEGWTAGRLRRARARRCWRSASSWSSSRCRPARTRRSAEMARPLPVCADESCHDRAEPRRARRPLRHGQHQARQGRRADRGAGAARRGAGGGLRHHGRLHGRLVARHGAGGAAGAGRRRSPTSTGRCCSPRDRAHPLSLRRRRACIRRRPSSGDEHEPHRLRERRLPAGGGGEDQRLRPRLPVRRRRSTR